MSGDEKKAPANSSRIDGLVAAAAHWIKERSGARSTPRSDVVEHVLSQLGDARSAPKRVVVLVAHPDDEAIGAGAAMASMPDVTVVHVTDGAPADDDYARRRGFESRDAYARARRQEVVAALGIIGVPEHRIRGLGFIDGEAAWHLVQLSHRVMDLFEELAPAVVLTHPYEGGHSDHDSTAFAVHLAAGLLQREGLPAPIILELTSYHNHNGRRRLFEFLPFQGTLMKTLRLTAEQRAVKRRVFETFASQYGLLQTFPVAIERFRQAPRYLFTVPPHDGQLDYERLCKKMTGAEWRTQAHRALETLRTRMSFRGGLSVD